MARLSSSWLAGHGRSHITGSRPARTRHSGLRRRLLAGGRPALQDRFFAIVSRRTAVLRHGFTPAVLRSKITAARCPPLVAVVLQAENDQSDRRRFCTTRAKPAVTRRRATGRETALFPRRELEDESLEGENTSPFGAIFHLRFVGGLARLLRERASDRSRRRAAGIAGGELGTGHWRSDPPAATRPRR